MPAADRRCSRVLVGARGRGATVAQPRGSARAHALERSGHVHAPLLASLTSTRDRAPPPGAGGTRGGLAAVARGGDAHSSFGLNRGGSVRGHDGRRCESPEPAAATQPWQIRPGRRCRGGPRCSVGPSGGAGEALHPDLAGRVGIRPPLPLQRRAATRAPALALPLQSPPTARRRRRCRTSLAPVNNVPGNYS